MPYATLAVVTNYAAGLQSTVTHDEVGELFEKRITDVKNILNYAIQNFWQIRHKRTSSHNQIIIIW